MNILIRGKEIEVTRALKEYVTKRVSKLEKYSDDFRDVHVTLLVVKDQDRMVKDRQRVEVTAPINSYILRGEEENDDMYSAIDLVVEKLERQIEKYRAKFNRRSREKAVKEFAVDRIEELQEEEEIVRIKKFPAKPMPVEEAVMQMEMIGHSFFAFTNAETQQFNVVYRRKDGTYGLLEPEV